MKTLQKHYKLLCEQKYQSLGFSNEKLTFVRLKGDVIQSFTLKCCNDVPHCTVDFGIFPLCLPQPFFLDAGGYLIDDFYCEHQNRMIGWIYVPKSEQSIKNYVESLLQKVDLYLLPFFEKCNSCETALSELHKLEALFDNNRKMCLAQINETDKAAPWQERSLFDPKKYYIALKSHDYLYARKYLSNKIEFYKNSLIEFDDPNFQRQPEFVKQRYAERLVSYTEELRCLDSRKYEFFDNMLKENEKQAHSFLKEKYPKVLINRT